tara:strand:+ start:243 stop:443 length:201 start_codon:yes stop_codon:yes gene_type:complete
MAKEEDVDSKAMTEIKAHERECAVRWDNLNRRLEEGDRRFTRLESLIIGLYILLISVGVIDRFITM